MAAIDLHRHEVEEGWMPPVCARCGKRGKNVRAKTAVSWPWWMPLLVIFSGPVIFLPFVRFLFLGTASGVEISHRVVIYLPFCDRHRDHWRRRSLPLAALLILALGMTVAGLLALGAAGPRDPANRVLVFNFAVNLYALIGIGGGVLGLLLWGLLKVVLPYTGIRVAYLSGTAITLTGVSERFCAAVNEQRRQKPLWGEVSLEKSAAARPSLTIAEPKAPPTPKKNRICDACGESYSQKKIRCPHCGEENDLLREGWPVLDRIPGFRDLPDTTKSLIVASTVLAVVLIGITIFYTARYLRSS